MELDSNLSSLGPIGRECGEVLFRSDVQQSRSGGAVRAPYPHGDEGDNELVRSGCGEELEG